MNISLTPELEQLIAAKVSSGYYHSSSEVVREGLRLLAERDELKQKRIEMLNQEIQKGIDSAKAGHLIDGDVAYAQIMKEHEQEK
jgi:antitoxin ParD1/3/4